MQYYFSHSSLLILVMSSIISYGLRLSLSSLLMLWQKALLLLLQKDLRVRDFISWSKKFSECICLKFWVHSSLLSWWWCLWSQRSFDAFPSVLMSLLLDLVSPLDIPLPLRLWLRVESWLVDKSSHWESEGMLQGFAASSSLLAIL